MKWTMLGQTTITIEGTPEEIKALEAMINGACYAGNPVAPPSGDCPQPKLRLERFESFTPMPDPDMEKFYQPVPAQGTFKIKDHLGERPMEFRTFTPGKLPEFGTDPGFSPSIWVKHITGYSGPNCYAARADLMARAGFELMRSKRGPDGRYWEAWYLPFLGHTVDGIVGEPSVPAKKERWPTLAEYMHFLCRTIGPGQIDVCQQRAALSMDD